MKNAKVKVTGHGNKLTVISGSKKINFNNEVAAKKFASMINGSDYIYEPDDFENLDN